MRGSVEAIAVARDVASSSPSKPASALDMMRYQRISPDCLPLANGGGGGIGGSGKQPAPAPRSSKDDDGQAVATDSSRLASYLATASLEPKLRARALHPPPPAQALAPAQASSSAAAAATRSPARHHGHHPSDFSDHTFPSPKGTVPDASMLLQWGHNKRSRGRRDASASASSPAPAPAMTPSQVRRQAALKVQRRHAAAEKLMPPPSTRGSNVRVTSSLPSRGAADAQHGRTAALPHNRSEERAVGQVPPPAAAAASKQQRPASDKAPPHKAEAGVVPATATPESKRQIGGSGGAGGVGHHHQAELLHGASPLSKPATGQRHELPRIYTTLSRKEKEEDFLAMKGAKLPQRPKKRPKLVDKAVSYICPGMWLTEVTRSKYEVREKKCTKKQKRRGGLKGMESSDSD